jgi:hypothetical protein
MSIDSFRDPQDVKRISELSGIIEIMRDFIVWLCEEECNSTVPEMQARFEKWEDEQEKAEVSTTPL